jgi:hypothetical protein
MLTTRRAYVVVLDEAVDPATGELAGKVEHLPSGESARFESSATLIRFIERHTDSGRKGE